ncbi:hypothetical protein NIES4075_20270 [Tolypothrix sp. NIES-4075]|uniref:hypothetical protein n=1 Tax=Tolypothrix sp. NIES-4075 TaxID=2005459 RepID=UPI000B5CE30B|nr:hypothetical protein [Tolypothrix sp. NIES-4075]GAX41059.1 hypothetical protein NIES4075_20270 [Tolypothrix sp. NIES-4075]
MKTAGKLASGWLLTLGFMFMTLSVSSVFDKIAMQKESQQIRIDVDEIEFTPANTASVNDNDALRYFVFGVPTLILGGWLAFGLYRESQQEKKMINQQVSDRLQSLFYRMLTENNGRVTVLSFAMQSQLPAAVAREYLDEKAQEFHANFKVSDDGAISYHFDV